MRRSIAVALLMASLNAAPAAPDDRRLMQANSSQCTFQLEPAANFFAAPTFPAFASGPGDEAIVGGVIPSHLYPSVSPSPAVASSWAIWSGSLKAYRLDAKGGIPTVAAATTPAPGATPTPTPAAAPVATSHPDESNPDDLEAAARRPVWNAARVLGYTDPVANLTGGLPPVATSSSSANAPAISVWPGRRIVWGDGTGPAVPIPRQDFLPDTGTCSGTCFRDLMTAMGLDPNLSNDVTKATQTVHFLRGGKTSVTGSRDEVLTELGTYGTVTAGTVYSYFYQDDAPAGNGPGSRTDGATNPPGYAHRLGDVFHSEAAVLLPPKQFQFLSANVTPRSGSCGALPDCSYGAFARLHSRRRKVVFVGANDGFLHAFDAGVWNRDTRDFENAFDLGTGRELFAYAPKAIMKATRDQTGGFPGLLNFPPVPRYFVDGSPAIADVFIDTGHGGTPSADNRTWKTVLVSGLRQGGQTYFALDVTQPDRVKTDVAATDRLYGTKLDARDNSPDCLDAGGGCAAAYPAILWEMTDDCALDASGCVANTSPMGETWSRPVLGRIRIGNGIGFEDRYVAILGGGFDASFNPGTPISAADTTIRGRSIDIVNLETGKILYKATAGVDDGGNVVPFAPMPAAPAVADVNDDGYLDAAYIGDLNGRMWRLDLTSGVCSGCGTSWEKLTGYRPFLLYDALMGGSQAQPIQPIFMEAGIIFVTGGVSPTLGIAFGTGYRAELLQPNRSVNRFHYVIDPGRNQKTFHDRDLINITPQGGVTPAGTGPAAAAACVGGTATGCGYFLDFATANEKAVSTVFSTLGNLSLVTFTPDVLDSNGGLCFTKGSSFRYSFSFLDGHGGYRKVPAESGRPGQLPDYQQSLSVGLAQVADSQGTGGMIIYSVLSDGEIGQLDAPAPLKTVHQNWKEQ